MSTLRRWRQNATANTDRDTGAERYRIRELRQARGHSHACEAEEKSACEAAEKEQVQGLAFLLSAPLAFGSLSLLIFAGKTIPRQSTARNLGAHKCEALSIRKFAPVVTEGLFVQVAE